MQQIIDAIRAITVPSMLVYPETSDDAIFEQLSHALVEVSQKFTALNPQRFLRYLVQFLELMPEVETIRVDISGEYAYDDSGGQYLSRSVDAAIALTRPLTPRKNAFFDISDDLCGDDLDVAAEWLATTFTEDILDPEGSLILPDIFEDESVLLVLTRPMIEEARTNSGAVNLKALLASASDPARQHVALEEANAPGKIGSQLPTQELS